MGDDHGATTTPPEDGRGAATPHGDNLVLDYARAQAGAFGAIVATNGGAVARDDELGLQLQDLAVGSPFGNTAMLTLPVADADTAAVVGRIRSFFAERPGGPFLVFSPWRTTDWAEHGFHPVGHPPLMLRAPGPVNAAVLHPPAADGLEIVEVGDPARLADFERTLVEAYPTPELQPWRPGVMWGPDVLETAWRLFVAYLDGAPVATAGAFVAPTVTAVEAVSTRPEARGRGIGAAVTAAATLAAPDRPAMLVSSDAGRGVYASLGYLPIQRHTLWLGLR